MDLEIGKIYHGFKLEAVKAVKEINAIAKVFVHEKSGAQLLFIDTDDDNKVFSITFRTPPKDSMGAAHIVEHSTLCGSRKFPLREPFVELVKGSLNTFLNAMTFSDKTMYPIASRNDKDFHNLMDVYLDAVFYPIMDKTPEIFMQEGWHYELENKDDDLTYKGVVYNEMLGAFSSPEAVLEKEIYTSLFPDTTYGFESGGDPDVITELTQEKFVEFHKRFYHPSNSYIYLYGKMNILEQLEFINAEYLSDFEKITVDSSIDEQPLFNGKKAIKAVYPISPEEETDEKTFLSWNAIVGRMDEMETMLALQIMEHFLLHVQGAPLKKALIDAGIAKDIISSFDDGILQPTFSIVANGSRADKLPLFEKTITETLEKLAADGIDRTLIQASMNLLEFKLREADFGSNPKGLIYNIKLMHSWLYDADPVMQLAYEKPLANIKNGIENGYFEKLIQERLLNNKHVTTVVMEPKPGMAEEKAAALHKMLQEYKAGLSDAELDKLVAQTQQLKKRQLTPDSPEALATIPLLARADISTQTEALTGRLEKYKDAVMLKNELPANSIYYLGLYFDCSTVPQALIPYLYLLADFVGKVSTEKHSYGELAKQINLHTGGISYDIGVYTDADDVDKYSPKFKLKAKALTEKLPKLLALLEEIILTSNYNEEKRMRELIAELKSNLEMSLLRGAQQVASARLMSYISQAGCFAENGMLSFFEFVSDLDKNFTERFAEISRNLAKVSSIIFNRRNLVISVVADKRECAVFNDSFDSFYEALSAEKLPKQEYKFELKKRNEGLMTPSKIQYVIKGANFKKLGFKYTGCMRVMETIMRYEYLWSKIRIQGGAYGAFTQFRRNGSMLFGSYRDPNLTESLEAYDGIADYLRSFTVDEREMTKYVIGTISGVDIPMTSQMKGTKAVECYMRNVQQADLQQERDEILATTQEDIRKIAELVEACMKENYLCVLGGEAKIRENEQVFNELKSVFA